MSSPAGPNKNISLVLPKNALQKIAKSVFSWTITEAVAVVRFVGSVRDFSFEFRLESSLGNRISVSFEVRFEVRPGSRIASAIRLRFEFGLVSGLVARFAVSV